MKRSLLVLLGLVAGAGPGRAEIVAKPVEYRHGATALEGLLVADSGATGTALPGFHALRLGVQVWQADLTLRPGAVRGGLFHRHGNANPADSHEMVSSHPADSRPGSWYLCCDGRSASHPALAGNRRVRPAHGACVASERRQALKEKEPPEPRLAPIPVTARFRNR